MRIPVEALPQALAAVLLAVLIAVLLRVRGRWPENRALAAFFGATMIFNIGSFVYATEPTVPVRDAAAAIATMAGIVDAVLLARFTLLYLRPASAGAWYGRAGPYALLGAFLAGFALFLRAEGDGPYQGDNAAALVDACLDVVWIVSAAALARSALRAPEGDAWRSRLILGTALALLFASFDLASIPLAGVVMDAVQAGQVSPLGTAQWGIVVLRCAGIFALVGYLLAAGARRPDKRRAATAAVLAICAAGLANVLEVGYAIPAGRPYLGISSAVAFLVEPLLVSYALLRHQLLGIDLQVKLGLSRGALAAIFLAVFFVVTQVAQGFLEGYGVLVGGAAAGLMLFAITPLQRAAERFADAAMPGVGGRRDLNARELAYKHALRFALSDRTVTREEELQLAHIADELRLSTQAATRLRQEVEIEIGVGRAT